MLPSSTGGDADVIPHAGWRLSRIREEGRYRFAVKPGNWVSHAAQGRCAAESGSARQGIGIEGALGPIPLTRQVAACAPSTAIRASAARVGTARTRSGTVGLDGPGGVWASRCCS